MRNTRITKRQTNLFSSRLTDDNSNKGAADESEIYGRHCTKIVIYSEKTLCIYIASSQGRTFFDLTTTDMGSELTYGLGKVLGTQNAQP